MAISRQIASSDLISYSYTALAKSAVQVAHTGDTNEFAAATVTIAAGAMGPNGAIRVRADFSCPSSANNKTIRVRLGGIGGTAVAGTVATTVTGVQLECVISNRNSASSQYTNGMVTRGTDQLITSTAATTSAINTASAQDLVISVQNANSGETTNLDRYVVEVVYGA